MCVLPFQILAFVFGDGNLQAVAQFTRLLIFGYYLARLMMPVFEFTATVGGEI